MNPWTAFLIGLVLGWLIEFAVDWFFWRRKTSDEIEIEQLQMELEAAENRIAELEGGSLPDDQAGYPADEAPYDEAGYPADEAPEDEVGYPVDEELDTTEDEGHLAEAAAVGAAAVVAAEVMDDSAEEETETIEEGMFVEEVQEPAGDLVDYDEMVEEEATIEYESAAEDTGQTAEMAAVGAAAASVAGEEDSAAEDEIDLAYTEEGALAAADLAEEDSHMEMASEEDDFQEIETAEETAEEFTAEQEEVYEAAEGDLAGEMTSDQEDEIAAEENFAEESYAAELEMGEPDQEAEAAELDESTPADSDQEGSFEQ